MRLHIRLQFLVIRWIQYELWRIPFSRPSKAEERIGNSLCWLKASLWGAWERSSRQCMGRIPLLLVCLWINRKWEILFNGRIWGKQRNCSSCNRRNIQKNRLQVGRRSCLWGVCFYGRNLQWEGTRPVDRSQAQAKRRLKDQAICSSWSLHWRTEENSSRKLQRYRKSNGVRKQK